MGYQTPNVTGDGGYGGGGGILGFLTQGLKSYQEGHATKLAEKQQKVENKQKADTAAEQKTMDTATIEHMNLENVAAKHTDERLTKADTTATAQNTYDNIVQQAIKFPETVKDPALMTGLLNAANVLGKPIVRNKDGSINFDALNPKQFDSLTTDQLAYYSGLDPTSRKSQMQGIGGIPDDFKTQKAIHPYEQETKRLTAGAAASVASSKVAIAKHADARADDHEETWKRKQNAEIDYTNAKTSTQKQEALARINHLNAESAKVGAEASAIGPRLQIAEQNLGLRSQELSIQLQKLQYDTSPTSLKNLHTATVALDENTNRVQGELTSAQSHLATYAASKSNGVIAPDDAVGQQLQSNINRLNNALYSANQQSGKARSALVGHQFQGIAMTKQSGGKASTIMPRKGAAQGTPIGDAPGVPDGTKGNFNGKPAVVRGGKAYAI